jgi:hypothetical protein
MQSFNFYPHIDNGLPIINVPFSDVIGVPDQFGCVETADGLYVPTCNMPAVVVGVDYDGDIFAI